MKYYAIKDELTSFKPMLPHTNDNEALRSVRQAIINKDIPTEYIKDTSFWLIGEYDEMTGNFTPNLKKLADLSAMGV